MSHSQTLRLEDVRQVFRLLGDVHDLRHDQTSQETLIVDGLCDLIGAPVGWAAVFAGYRPGLDTRIERFTTGTITESKLLTLLGAWSEIGDLHDDPMVRLGRPNAAPSGVVSRSERVSTREWRDYRIYDGLIAPSQVVDNMALWFRYPGSDRIRGYALWRFQDDGEFEPRRVRVARLFAEELAHLHAEGKLEPPGVFDKLPDRLKRLVPLLMGDLGQKQIAARTGLSYTTVRSYTKELYQLTGVRSREALVALMRGGGP